MAIKGKIAATGRNGKEHTSEGYEEETSLWCIGSFYVRRIILIKKRPLKHSKWYLMHLWIKLSSSWSARESSSSWLSCRLIASVCFFPETVCSSVAGPQCSSSLVKKTSWQGPRVDASPTHTALASSQNSLWWTTDRAAPYFPPAQQIMCQKKIIDSP